MTKPNSTAIANLDTLTEKAGEIYDTYGKELPDFYVNSMRTTLQACIKHKSGEAYERSAAVLFGFIQAAPTLVEKLKVAAAKAEGKA